MLNTEIKQDVPQSGSLTDQAYSKLEELIVTIQLKPGAVLSESALAAQLGIGRTPIREALHRLAREGLVVILPRRGILVSEINIHSQLRLLEVRRKIEEVMVEAATRRATTEERERFRQIASGMKDCVAAGDDMAFIRFDNQFNNLVSESCRNEFAAKAIGLTAGLSRRFWFVHNKQQSDLETVANRHADVATSIADGDIDAAITASGCLMDYVLEVTRASIDS